MSFALLCIFSTARHKYSDLDYYENYSTYLHLAQTVVLYNYSFYSGTNTVGSTVHRSSRQVMSECIRIYHTLSSRTRLALERFVECRLEGRDYPSSRVAVLAVTGQEIVVPHDNLDRQIWIV